MKKNGLMTFTCSFLLSLLTIFLADKVFFRAQKNEDRSEIKISNNNITLFLSEEDKIMSGLKTQEVTQSELLKLSDTTADTDDFKEYAQLLDEEREVYEEKGSEATETLLASNSATNFEEAKKQVSLAERQENKDAFVVAEAAPSLVEEKVELGDQKMKDADNIFLDTPTMLSSMNAPEVQDEKLALEATTSYQGEPAPKSIVEKTEKIIAEISLEKNKPQEMHADEDDFIPIQRSFADNSGKKVNIKTKSTETEVAMVKDTVPIESMTKKEKSESQWEKMTPEENSSPWVVAKSRSDTSNFIVPKEVNKMEDVHALELSKNLNIEPSKQENEIKVAEMVRNILIPIPDDILKEGNVTPQLISSQKNKEIQTKIEQSMSERRQESTTLAINEEKPEKKAEAENTETNADETPAQKKSKKTILDSLSSIFSGETPVIGITKQNEKEDKSTDIYKNFTKKSKNKDKVTKILPTEIKLSFQPNRAEISGPTLRWIEAFANKVEEDKDVVLEVRIDGTSAFELQQKRLRLLHNILTNKGVEYSKINTVFTTREPNSFIIRAVRLENNTVERNNKEVNNMAKIYQNW